MLWRSVSMSREVTWDHRTGLRRFSRRVTTAELILRCPDMPSTQGAASRQGRTCVLVMSRVLRRVKACTEPRHYDEKRGTAAPALRMNEAWPRGAGATEEKVGHWGICASEEYVRWLRDVVRKRGTCCRARWQSVRAVAHAPVALLMRVG